MNTMTKREFLTAIANSNVEENLKEYALDEIRKLDERNKKRKSTMSNTQIENETLKEKIIELLKDNEELVASVIGEYLQVSTQKASALCRQLVECGSLQVKEVKIPKKGKVKAYYL